MHAVESPSLLKRFDGQIPPRADWFTEAIALEPERSTFASSGARIELLTWGSRGKPGLLFLHGNGAHADWWTFIAPFFAKDYRCAAISWSGMGGSEWRDSYDIPTYASEVLDAIDAAGLGEGPARPILVGHSFGGVPLLYIAAHHPDRIAAGIVVDTFIPTAAQLGDPARRRRFKPSGSPSKRYGQLADALARYRFMPEQDSPWPEIVDHIARTSLHYLEADGDLAAGWTWKFDPKVWSTIGGTSAADWLGEVKVPVGLIVGEQSRLVTAELSDSIRDRLAHCPFYYAIPHARHHVMVDQPIAFVSAVGVALQTMIAPQVS